MIKPIKPHIGLWIALKMN